MHRVKKVEYVEEYKLRLTFGDRVVKAVDLKSYLTKGIFLQLKDIEHFKQVFIDGHSIAWPNGADFCPDVLFEMGKTVVAESSSLKPLHRKKRISNSPIA